MEVIDTVVGPSVAGSSIVWDIGLREEIHNVRGRVYHGSSDNTDGVGDIGASNVRLQEGRVYLTSVDSISCFSVQSSYPILS